MNRKIIKATIAIIALSALSACSSTNLAQSNDLYRRDNSDRLSAKLSFVSIPVTNGDKNWNLGAVLRAPYKKDGDKVPAVIIVHGSGGVDSRGGHYAQELNKIGIATLEIDLWAARGVKTALERPKTVQETLPDTYAALNFLVNNPNIAANKIGITGFSWGGVVSMLTSVEANNTKYAINGERFAAHAPFYPVCWVYNKAPGYEFKDLTGAPILIQAGKADLYDAPDTCEKLLETVPAKDRANVKLIMHDNATHAWERREPDAEAFDPYSHLGKGGLVPLKYNAKAAEDGTNTLIEFFTKNLKN